MCDIVGEDMLSILQRIAVVGLIEVDEILKRLRQPVADELPRALKCLTSGSNKMLMEGVLLHVYEKS